MHAVRHAFPAGMTGAIVGIPAFQKRIASLMRIKALAGPLPAHREARFHQVVEEARWAALSGDTCRIAAAEAKLDVIALELCED